MFWIKTIKEIKEASAAKWSATQKRINQLSDYIQGPLQEIVDKAIANYFKQLENIIKDKNKKDK